MRAILLASAHTALLRLLRASTASAQPRSGSSGWPARFFIVAAWITERAPCVSNIRRYTSPRLEMRPSLRCCPEECSLGVSPNHEAKCRASLYCATSPLVAATIAVAVSKPTPGIDSNVSHADD